MAKRPQDRYASAGDLARAAHEALTNPDQNHATNILRRSEEITLPGLKSAIPSRPSPGGSPGSPTRVPDARLIGRAAQPPPNYQHQQPRWGAPPPSAPQQFAGAAPFQQQPPPRQRNPWAIVVGAAAVVVVLVLAAVGISIAMGNDDNETPNAHSTATTTTTSIAATTTTTTTPPPSTPSPDPEAQNRLSTLLPAGYPPGTCKPDAKPMPGSIASVICGQNSDPNGPTIAAYGLFADRNTLQGAFKGFMASDAVVKCPGNKDSPGTWWHNKDPNTVIGQIACVTYQGNVPRVMWTNQQTLVVALVNGKPQGPNLDQLYKWWTSHS
jgi:serine/threonine-protein kinase